LDRLAREAGRHVTLADVPPAQWDAVAERGFDVVFLMGVWRRSAIGRQLALADPGLLAEYDRVLPGWTPDDVPGSPYCIQAYEPDPRMGGWTALDEARRQLHARGIALMLDFVPNHLGFDHPWIDSHPERFVLGSEADARSGETEFRRVESVGRTTYVACGRDPFFPAWRDVAQLNYCNPDTREAMRSTLREIGAHCDGVRCDMAMLVLNDVFERTWRRVLRDEWPRPSDEFWPAATAAVPHLTFLAEVYWGLERTLLDQGFHFAYDKRLLDALHSHHGGEPVRQVLEPAQPDPGRLARFLENHDEPRSAATLAGRLPAAAALVATTPGMRFFYDGQFEGRRIKAPVQLGRWPDERRDDEIEALYGRIFAVLDGHLFHDGEWRLLAVSHAGDDSFRNIVAYRWKHAEDVAVVVSNPSGAVAQAHLAVSGDLGDGAVFGFADALNGETYRWTADALRDTGLYVRLEAGRAHLFRVHTLPD
jgi:hypothetical protein